MTKVCENQLRLTTHAFRRAASHWDILLFIPLAFWSLLLAFCDAPLLEEIRAGVMHNMSELLPPPCRCHWSMTQRVFLPTEPIIRMPPMSLSHCVICKTVVLVLSLANEWGDLEFSIRRRSLRLISFAVIIKEIHRHQYAPSLILDREVGQVY